MEIYSYGIPPIPPQPMLGESAEWPEGAWGGVWGGIPDGYVSILDTGFAISIYAERIVIISFHSPNSPYSSSRAKIGQSGFTSCHTYVFRNWKFVPSVSIFQMFFSWIAFLSVYNLAFVVSSPDQLSCTVLICSTIWHLLLVQVIY